MKYVIVLGLLITTFVGCKKKEVVVVPDTTKPTFTIIKPTAGQTLVPGNTILFQATFSDNVKLKSYEIVVSKVVTGGLILKVVPTSIDFSYTKPSTNFTSGVKQQEINLSDIVIPANTATTITTTGKYNFKVTCVDMAGNSNSTTVEININ